MKHDKSFKQLVSGHATVADAVVSLLANSRSDGCPSIRELLNAVDFEGHCEVSGGFRRRKFSKFLEWERLENGHTDAKVSLIEGTGGLGKSVVAGRLIKRLAQQDTNKNRCQSLYSSFIASFFFMHNQRRTQ
jgi:hypothetical protein